MDRTHLIRSSNKTILQLPPSDSLTTISEYEDEPGELKDGRDGLVCFNGPHVLTVDRTGNVVVVDVLNHDLHTVTKGGSVVNTVVVYVETRFEDGQDQNTCFNNPDLHTSDTLFGFRDLNS